MTLVATLGSTSWTHVFSHQARLALKVGFEQGASLRIFINLANMSTEAFKDCPRSTLGETTNAQAPHGVRLGAGPRDASVSSLAKGGPTTGNNSHQLTQPNANAKGENSGNDSRAANNTGISGEEGDEGGAMGEGGAAGEEGGAAGIVDTSGSQGATAKHADAKYMDYLRKDVVVVPFVQSQPLLDTRPFKTLLSLRDAVVGITPALAKVGMPRQYLHTTGAALMMLSELLKERVPALGFTERGLHELFLTAWGRSINIAFNGVKSPS